MVISVSCKVQNNSKKLSLYPVILLNAVRSYTEWNEKYRTAKSTIVFLIFLEVCYISHIVKRMDKYLDDECVAILMILCLMMTADMMYIQINKTVYLEP